MVDDLSEQIDDTLFQPSEWEAEQLLYEFPRLQDLYVAEIVLDVVE